MKQLSGLDAQFLAMETGAVFGHVASVCVLDPSTASEPFTLEHLTKAIEARLPLVPLLRQRLVEVPMGLDHPYWIGDPDFDIEFHVRELALPTPGNARQLSEQVARLHARPLDRSRPLWEVYLIQGLPQGRVAVYSKIHHAAVDGVSGSDILSALLDLSPEGRPEPVETTEFHGEQPPGWLGLLTRSAGSALRQPRHAVEVVGELASSSLALAGLAGNVIGGVAGGLTGSLARGPLGWLVQGDGSRTGVLPGIPLRAPRTPFNAPVTSHRRWSPATIPLAEVKQVRRGTSLTVNDVVLALCTGALRRWLMDHDALPDVPLVSAVPVSVRTRDQRGALGNQVSLMFAALPTHLPTSAERLAATHEAMAAAKDQHGALPASLLADVTQFAMPVLANQAWRLSARLRLFERVAPFNLIISNVPGPPVSLYLAGAELEAYYPVSAISDGNGLNITVMSYRGNLFFGLVSCRELVPDLDAMAGYLRAELDEMLAEGGVAG
jgi:diacylglycerol O-acyltransferase